MKVPFIFLFIILSVSAKEQMQLKQVLILSRHNVRTPLAKNLAQMTPKPWPSWREKSGYLTQKGFKLEGFMGNFFNAWLHEEGLLTSHCPHSEEVFIYANSKQRTRASAQAFVENAFKNCNVTVHHNDSDKSDPLFNPVIHNSSLIFRQLALEQMRERLKSLSLNNSYENIEIILDYKDSQICRVSKNCDMTKDKNSIIDVAPGYKPNILGPLKIGNSVIDAFVMENYEGFPLKNVAWGNLYDMKQWKTIMDLSRGYHNVIFNTTLIAKDIAGPLIKYMSNIFFNDITTLKVILLMGHDANLYTVLNGMNFKPYYLPKQYEITPVGGKIVFQRWHDMKKNKDLLKINYVYQSTKQMRDGLELNLHHPPEFALLELDKCKVDDEGFCLWEDFVKLLKSLQ